jgi:hypothetical protein
MSASTRRSRTTLLRRADGRPHAGLAVAAALTLGLAACGNGDDDADDDAPELEEPAEDVEADPETDTETDTEPDPDAEDETAAPEAEQPPGFTTLEDGELVPGVSIDAPIDEEASQGQPTPTGSAFVAALEGETGALTINVEFEGQELDELLAGIDALVESGQAEVTSEPEETEVEGADEASRVELSAPGGEATATGIFAIAGDNAVSIAIEALEGSDIDVEAIIDSIVIDADRLQAEGPLELDDAPAPDGDTDGTDEDAGTGDDAATDPDDEG